MRARVLAFLAVLLVLAGCDRAQAPSTAPASSASHPLNQAGCDGVPVPQSPPLLPADAVITAVTFCAIEDEYVAGDGIWQVDVVRTAPAAGIAPLRAALRHPDQPRTTNACSAEGYVLPDFVVTLADGSRMRPRLPSDGCHPVTTGLPDMATWPVVHSALTERIRTDAQTKAGCGDAASSPAVWLPAHQDTKAKGTITLPTGAVGVCRYHGAGKDDSLTTLGLVPLSAFRAAWPIPSTTAPPGCLAATPDGPVGDWLVFSAAPVPPYRADLVNQGEFALVELDGCRRVASPGKGLIGFVSSAQADRLAALANRSP